MQVKANSCLLLHCFNKALQHNVQLLPLLELKLGATWQRTESTWFCLFFIGVMRNGVSSTFTYGRIYLWSDLEQHYYCQVIFSIHITASLCTLL